jgi:FtsH-binding integral membrane protein
MLACCRYLALVYAIGLAIAEAVLNSIQGQWQYAPMWVIDYVIVAYLLAGFWATRRGRAIPVLLSAYALSAGVVYMAFFASFDPDLPPELRGPPSVVALIGLALAASVLGLIGTTAAWARQERTDAAGGG